MSKKLVVVLTFSITSFLSSISYAENSEKSDLSTSVQSLISYGLKIKHRADEAIKQTANSLGINPIIVTAITHGAVSIFLTDRIHKVYPLSLMGLFFTSQLLTYVLIALNYLGDSLYAANVYSLTPEDARQAIEDAELLLIYNQKNYLKTQRAPNLY